MKPATVFAVMLLVTSLAPPTPAQDLSALMPRIGDHTSMWWKDGFPGVVSGAPWHRCIQTGHYALVLDTETLTIPHFGPIPPGTSYRIHGASLIRNLPPADLTLGITVDGKSYRCTAGRPWSQFAGPRLIESGRFFQRADVTDLVFSADDGTRLNVEARFETAAWPDRLGLILAARPGRLPIPAGQACFGRVDGGFGLDGENHFEIPPDPRLDLEEFTLEFWTFVPTNYKASQVSPWLVCKNRNEFADGNFGIMILPRGVPRAQINIGGGRDNAFATDPISSPALKLESWNHLGISYDGRALRLYVNGKLAGETEIGRRRVPAAGPLAFGRRQDNWGDGYRFRGVIDEIHFYDRALSVQELRLRYANPEIEQPALRPVAQWTFRDSGRASQRRPSQQWKDASMEIELQTAKRTQRRSWLLPQGQTWTAGQWHEVSLTLDRNSTPVDGSHSMVTVRAVEIPSGTKRPVQYDDSIGWHRVNLDGIQPIVPGAGDQPSNDAIERVKLVLSNSTDRPQLVRLMFEKTERGFRQRIGTPITGISAVLRDRRGNPTGIPVQLSKNWHNNSQGGLYAGQWFHGISQVRLPSASTIELELTLAYGHWGGVAAASHAQLSLVGWGSNQLWNQSALGSWGESICYEPEQVQAGCTITDVRPLMVYSMGRGARWDWTSNVGGGDFFRFFDPSGERVPHTAVRTVFHQQGPCLTEVTYDGRIGDGITHATTVSLARSNDLVRGIYQIRLDVHEAKDFSRLVIFQVGADTYSPTGERKMAVGNETGLDHQWATQWGGDVYRCEPVECTGRIPWASLHEAVMRENQQPGPRANRGVVIRSWQARLGGKDCSPWMAERGLDLRSITSSTLDILPPSQVTRLEPGDFVEATIEHIIMPQFERDYYGPNEALRAALGQHENTWQMIYREAVGNDRDVQIQTGTLQRLYPDVRILTLQGRARLKLSGGLGYVPITFGGLSSAAGYRLLLDGRPVDQSVHGNDFWQTDYDPATRRWSQTYNIPLSGDQPHLIQFEPVP